MDSNSKTYSVILTKIKKYEFVIDAESSEEAISMIRSMNDDERMNYFLNDVGQAESCIATEINFAESKFKSCAIEVPLMEHNIR